MGNKSYDDDEDDFEKDKPFEVSADARADGSFTFAIYLFGPIKSAVQFVPALKVFQAATENDEVVVYIQTPGGSLDATDTFINAMEDCAATITFIASGGVHSAGSLILLNAKNIVLSDGFNCLIHNGSTVQGGKFSDFQKAVEFHAHRFQDVLRKTYKHFLTDQEIEDVISGKDIWLDAEDFVSRIDRREKILQQEVDGS